MSECNSVECNSIESADLTYYITTTNLLFGFLLF